MAADGVLAAPRRLVVFYTLKKLLDCHLRLPGGADMSIYFIQEGATNYIKIGSTDGDVRVRLSTIISDGQNSSAS